VIEIDQGKSGVAFVIAHRVHPKGSFRAIPSRNGPCPVCKRGYPVLVENDDHRAESTRMRKLLKEVWGDQPPIDRPVCYNAVYRYVKPKTSRDPYPYHVGDLDKLMRRALDWLGGGRKDPGPILANDHLVVSTGEHRKIWSLEDSVLIRLEYQ